MVELVPYPFPALIRRMFRELEERGSIFDLPADRFWLGSATTDPGVVFHGARAATALGPAAGPQSQMAQNLVLSWLSGSRILELKTVQIDDRLTIPRPCIDMQTVGYNVEWSQELLLEQSLEEYVKGSMLIEMLAASGALELPADAARFLFDMSVGYDLNGIRSERVMAFVRGMLDAGEVVERLRAEIPAELGSLRDLDFTTRLSESLTLSTFHGCPPDEIERIVDYLLREVGLHTIVKLNPMLLGPARARELLNERMGYADLRIPDTAFERDTRWDQAVEFCERLGETAGGLGLGFGVKFSNTLIVENHREFFPPSEREMYLSGQPLHVLAMNLVRQFRAHFEDRFPISFSAGIDRKNFADGVALGLCPVTVCSDLLRPGGYARSTAYLTELERRMSDVGARDVGEFTLLAHGNAEAATASLPAAVAERCRAALRNDGDLRTAAGEAFGAWISAARLLNTDTYVERATDDPRYHAARNAKPPRKLGSHLELFDCITCDKCVPVCPNDANFTFSLAKQSVRIRRARPMGGGFEVSDHGTLEIEEKHQIGNFADFCNECGNCDVFCPEDGGPYLVKPRFFSTLESFRREPRQEGFFVERDRIVGRCDGLDLELEVSSEETRLRGPGIDVVLDAEALGETLRGRAEGELDLTWARILLLLHRALLSGEPTWVRVLAESRP